MFCIDVSVCALRVEIWHERGGEPLQGESVCVELSTGTRNS